MQRGFTQVLSIISFDDIIQVERMIRVQEDIQIIKQVLQGQPNQYEQLMTKYHNEMFSFVFNMVGQYQDTEDLVQDIFFKTYQNLSKYKPDKASFRTWLYRIASNHTINFLQKARKRYEVAGELDLSLLQDSEDIIESLVKDDQLNQIVQIMKNTLKDKHFKIMALHYFSGLTVKEIGETMNIPIKTIYKAIHSSIEKIQQEVNNHA